MEYVNLIVDKFNLASTTKEDSEELQQEKKYFYEIFRDHINKKSILIDGEWNGPESIFTAHCFSFNNLIRFNKEGGFNAPFGYHTGRNITIVEEILKELDNQKIDKLYNLDFEFFVLKILNEIPMDKDWFFYFDPPYTGTTAVYNENKLTGWTNKDDERLFKILNSLDALGIKWAMSNTLTNKKGEFNGPLVKWICNNKWEVYNFDKKYAVFGKSNAKNKEVLICNYKKD